MQNELQTKVVVKWIQSSTIQHSKAFHICSSLWALSSCTQALHPSLKSPIITTEAMQGFILTTKRRLIKILASCNANKEDYIWRTPEGLTDTLNDD